MEPELWMRGKETLEPDVTLVWREEERSRIRELVPYLRL